MKYGYARKVIATQGNIENVEELLKETIGYGTVTRLSPDYFTPKAKRVLETAVSGSNNLGKKYVGTEHILLAILSENDNYAIRFLHKLGVNTDLLIQDTLTILNRFFI